MLRLLPCSVRTVYNEGSLSYQRWFAKAVVTSRTKPLAVQTKYILYLHPSHVGILPCTANFANFTHCEHPVSARGKKGDDGEDEEEDGDQEESVAAMARTKKASKTEAEYESDVSCAGSLRTGKPDLCCCIACGLSNEVVADYINVLQ